MGGMLVGRLVGVLVGVWVKVAVTVGVFVAVGCGVLVAAGVSVNDKNVFCVESAWIVCTSAVAVKPVMGVSAAGRPKANRLQALEAIAAANKNKSMTR